MGYRTLGNRNKVSGSGKIRFPCIIWKEDSGEVDLFKVLPIDNNRIDREILNSIYNGQTPTKEVTNIMAANTYKTTAQAPDATNKASNRATTPTMARITLSICPIFFFIVSPYYYFAYLMEFDPAI